MSRIINDQNVLLKTFYVLWEIIVERQEITTASVNKAALLDNQTTMLAPVKWTYDLIHILFTLMSIDSKTGGSE